jgi:hypothetical protein
LSNRERRQGKRRRQRRLPAARRRGTFGAGLAVGASLVTGGTAQAADFPVTNTDDDATPPAGSLRDAILDANANDGTDTITFGSSLSGTISLDNDLPTIDDGVYIYGPASGAVTVDGVDSHQIFHVEIAASNSADNVSEISDLTLTNGSALFGGGAVSNAVGSDLSLFRMVMTGNESNNMGGAIFNGGTLSLSGSTLSGNTGGEGGAIHNNAGDVTIDHSSITGQNEGVYGGAIATYYGYLDIEYSTIGDNTASQRGGGLTTTGTYTTVRYSTIAGNDASVGGGIYVGGARTVNIENSTISGNTADQRGGGIEIRQGHAEDPYGVNVYDSTVADNYAGTHRGGGISESLLSEQGSPQQFLPALGNTIAADNRLGPVATDADLSGSFQVNQSLVESPGDPPVSGGDNLIGVDPQLQPLAENGGPTQTQAPLVSSPAIDASSSGLPYDQRLFDRPVDLPTIANTGAAGDFADIGAVELQSETDSQPPPGGAAATPSNQFSFGKLKRNLKRGTAKLTVVVPGPGTLTLRGKGLVKQRPAAGALASKVVSAAGKVKLLIKSKGRKRKKLNATGKVKVKPMITYTPTGGSANSKTKRVKLKKRL